MKDAKSAYTWANAPETLTAREAAALLRLGYTTLLDLIKASEWLRETGRPDPDPIPCVRNGVRPLLPTKELREWWDRRLRDHRLPSTADYRIARTVAPSRKA